MNISRRITSPSKNNNPGAKVIKNGIGIPNSNPIATIKTIADMNRETYCLGSNLFKSDRGVSLFTPISTTAINTADNKIKPATRDGISKPERFTPCKVNAVKKIKITTKNIDILAVGGLIFAIKKLILE